MLSAASARYLPLSARLPNFLLPIPDLRLDKYVSQESVKEEIGKGQEAINIKTEIFHVPDVAELIPKYIQVLFGIFNALAGIVNLHDAAAAIRAMTPPIKITGMKNIASPNAVTASPARISQPMIPRIPPRIFPAI